MAVVSYYTSWWVYSASLLFLLSSSWCQYLRRPAQPECLYSSGNSDCLCHHFHHLCDAVWVSNTMYMYTHVYCHQKNGSKIGSSWTKYLRENWFETGYHFPYLSFTLHPVYITVLRPPPWIFKLVFISLTFCLLGNSKLFSRVGETPHILIHLLHLCLLHNSFYTMTPWWASDTFHWTV